jgi:hypothetical protein
MAPNNNVEPTPSTHLPPFIFLLSQLLEEFEEVRPLMEAAAAEEHKLRAAAARTSSMSSATHSQAPSSELSAVNSVLDQQQEEGEEGNMVAPAKRFGVGLRVRTTPDPEDEQQGASLHRRTLSPGSRGVTPESVAGGESGPDVQPIFRMLMSDKYDTMADAVKVR